MLETPEARAKLRRKLESWPDARKSPVTINQGFELLDMVDRLEKEADWLAQALVDSGHILGNICDDNLHKNWREAARKEARGR